VAERQFGPYRLVRQIAVGGMAEIHLAKTKGIAGFEKYVALKMIHPNFAEDDQFIQMLVDEAKIAVQLTHGNIAQTFDLGRVGETYYITMEFVDGADLYRILRRASEQDIEMPLDVCAFIAKEVGAALDHAHRKRDNFGKQLGIVHRDVSPQNVLISYSGEVKLVDFGIAKATMKARQTAVGVIKGKYYYMSPEQAWGEKIDHRSDIFSAGIVLYEMITGQMLYLEEDLHKLLDMARRADIAPPSKLRKGVPPQLARIVMHALAKQPGDRYQTAGDMASDLERFLHTYSPVFTASKVAQLIKRVVGDPASASQPMDAMPSIEIAGDILSTQEIAREELARAREEIRDENSVIFRVAELKQPQQEAPKKPSRMMGQSTRAVDPAPASHPGTSEPARRPSSQPKPRSPQSRPRLVHEETRQLGAAPPNPEHGDSDGEDSGLITADGRRVDPATWDASATHPGDDVQEQTVISGAPRGFMMDVASEDGVDATIVSGGPPSAGPTHDTHDTADAPLEDSSFDDKTKPANARQQAMLQRRSASAVEEFPSDDADEEDTTDGAPGDYSDDEGPTLSRQTVPKALQLKGKAPPPALAAKIHAPAVSELRRPKASRRTPPGGVPAAAQSQPPNVLQAIVGAQASEPMPAPRPPLLPHQPHHPEPPQATLLQSPPPQFPQPTPGAQPQYTHDASGLPMTPPSGVPAPNVAQVPGVPPHLAPYLQMQGVPPGYGGYPTAAPYPHAQHVQQAQQQPVTPGALYAMSPYGPPPHPMSLTGQLRLSEVDELPSQYRIGSARRRWFTYIVAGMLAVSVAAGATFFIIRATREAAPTTASIHVVSVPDKAEIVIDGRHLTSATPTTIAGFPVGTRVEIHVELARHATYSEIVDIPNDGSTVEVTATLQPITGKVVINSRPAGAEIWINGQLRGLTPGKITDLDMDQVKRLELRLKDYQPTVVDLVWPSDGVISLDIPLSH
jgi:serine/threonine protein kinase